MTTLTIHNLDPETERQLRGRARRDRTSLNQTLKNVLAEAMGTAQRPGKRPDNRADFEEFCGLWDDADLAEFRRTTADMRSVDPGDWQ